MFPLLFATVGGYATTVAVAETTDLPWWASILVGFVVPICVLIFNASIEILHHFGKISDATYKFLGGFVKDLADDGKLNGSANAKEEEKKQNDKKDS